MEHGHEKMIEDVPDLSVVGSEQNEMSDNKTSVSTEGPDSSDVTTPESAANVDTTQSMGTDVNKPTTTDSMHLNTDSVTPSLLSPVSSPVHIVRTMITQDDPLGVFTNTVTSTSSKMTTDPRTSRSSDDVVKSALMEEESVLMRRISEDAIGRTSWVAGATDSSLRKCSSLNRLSSESTRHKTSAVTTSAAMSQGTVESASASSSPRTSLLGGTFRSAASRFASKYRVIRESVVPPSQLGKDVPSEPSGSGQEQCLTDATDSVTAAVISDVSDIASPETVDAAVGGAVSSDAVSKTVPNSTAMVAQSGKSRLRVPTALYSPLGKCLIFSIIHLLS